MKNNALNNLVIAAFIFLLAVLMQIFLPSMGIFFLGEWPLFILVFVLNYFQKGGLPLFFAILAGVLIDFFSGLSFGVFTLTLFSVGLIAQAAQDRLKGSSPASFITALIFCGLVFFGLARLFLYVFSII